MIENIYKLKINAHTKNMILLNNFKKNLKAFLNDVNSLRFQIK